jgi:hypothetical protein
VTAAKEDLMPNDAPAVIWFEKLGRTDVSRVGGNNAALGELVRNLGNEAYTCRRHCHRSR